MNIKPFHLLVLACTASSSLALAQAPVSDMSADKPDNSKANGAQVNSAVKSSIADGQGNSASDVKITQRIRQSVMADKNLSTYAHNVKIVSVDGSVTLNGVVRTAHERASIERKARAVAGKGRVTDDLTIAPTT